MRSTNILILLVALNASALLVGFAGLGPSLGYQPTIGGDDKVEQANQTAGDVDSDRGAFDSFVGAVISAAQQLFTIFEVVTAGPRMIINLGVPAPIVTALSAPLYIIVGLDLLQVLSGRSIT